MSERVTYESISLSAKFKRNLSTAFFNIHFCAKIYPSFGKIAKQPPYSSSYFMKQFCSNFQEIWFMAIKIHVHATCTPNVLSVSPANIHVYQSRVTQLDCFMLTAKDFSKWLPQNLFKLATLQVQQTVQKENLQISRKSTMSKNSHGIIPLLW